MSDSMLALLFTLSFFTGLILLVPVLSLINRCIRAIASMFKDSNEAVANRVVPIRPPSAQPAKSLYLVSRPAPGPTSSQYRKAAR